MVSGYSDPSHGLCLGGRRRWRARLRSSSRSPQTLFDKASPLLHLRDDGVFVDQPRAIVHDRENMPMISSANGIPWA